MLTAFLIIVVSLLAIVAGITAGAYRLGRRDGAEQERHCIRMQAARRAELERWTTSLLQSAGRARDWDAWLDELAPDETGPQQVIP